MTRVLAVDDEPAILRAITIALTASDYQVDVAATGKQAVARVASTDYDIIILDLGLPDFNGLEVIRRVKAIAPAVPIIVLSAWQEIETKVSALDLGADDYVAKPVSMPELLARIRVALRHVHREAGATLESTTIVRGPITIDTALRSVLVRGELVELPRRQYDLMRYLAEHPNRVLTHRAITGAVWGHDTDITPENLRVVISQLRKRIELDSSQPKLIRTDLGVGYRFLPDAD